MQERHLGDEGRVEPLHEEDVVGRRVYYTCAWFNTYVHARVHTYIYIQIYENMYV